MKKVAFILYVGCVLAFSAFARAEMVMPFSKNSSSLVSVKVDSVSMQANSELRVHGELPNTCTETPAATLVRDQEDPNVLVLHMTSQKYLGICTWQVGYFDTIVSLPVIAQNTLSGLDPHATYQIKVEGHDFETQIVGAELLRVPGFIGQ